MKYTAHQFTKVVQSLPPASRTAVAATTGIGIDCKGFDELLVIVNAGTAASSAELDVRLKEHTAVTGSGFSHIASSSFVQIAPANDVTAYVGRVNLKKRKRFIQTSILHDGTNAVVAGVVYVLTGAKILPVTMTNTVTVNL